MERNADSPLAILKDCFYMILDVIKSIIISVYRFVIPPDQKTVAGEIVLITGSAGGIGRQLSKVFAKLGCGVVLWDINETENEITAKEIRDIGGTCYTYTVDVGNYDDVYKSGQKVLTDVGEVNILINNAGVVIGKHILDCPNDLIERTFDVNLLGPFWTVKCFLPLMLRRNHGHIVNIASSAGLVGLSKLSDYSASKYGIVGFTEVLHYELVFGGYDRVHTTLVCPSFVKTKMFDGCKMRFPRLTAPLTIEDCVNRIVQAVLTNQTVVYMPRYFYFICLLKVLLPVKALDQILKFSGAGNFMDTFVYRNVDLRGKPKLTEYENCQQEMNGNAKNED